MNFLIEKSEFIEIKKISSLKSHIEKIIEMNILKDKILGKIEISLTYTDNNQEECFKTLVFDYDINIEELNVTNINLSNVYIYVVEGNGINLEYSLNLEYDDSKEIELINVDTIEEIKEEIETLEEKVLAKEELDKILSPNTLDTEEIKEEIKESYEKKLEDALERNDDIKIISSKNPNEDFISFFDSNFSSYFKLKTLECKNHDELKRISEDYNVSLDILELGYSFENKTVTFKLNE